MSDPGWYGDILAGVHDQQFTDLARAAARTALTLLPPPADSGLVVDLGCGSGVSAEILTAAGYQVVGIDLSPQMIAIARQRVPEGYFEAGSIYDSVVPDCQAVLATGEIFNYASSDWSLERVAGLLKDIKSALRPEGFLLFDIAEPGRASQAPRQRLIESPSSTMWVRAVEASPLASGQQQLTRDILTFTRRSDGGSTAERTRRVFESHTLNLFSAMQMQGLLAESGLTHEVLPGYVDLPVGPHWSTWISRESTYGARSAKVGQAHSA